MRKSSILAGSKEFCSKKTVAVAEYNKANYGFIDDAVLYSVEGKAGTEKMFYEGYRLVEDKR